MGEVISLDDYRKKKKPFVLYDEGEQWYKMTFEDQTTALLYLQKCFQHGWGSQYTKARSVTEIQLPDLGYGIVEPNVDFWEGETKIITRATVESISGDVGDEEALNQLYELQEEFSVKGEEV